MKSILYIALLYLCFSVLAVGCTKNAPGPVCVQAEVLGPNPCENSWYILKLTKDENNSGEFVGQLESGYVTTNNLPEAYQQKGAILQVALELNGEYVPRCFAVYRLYPAVRLKRVCSAG